MTGTAEVTQEHQQETQETQNDEAINAEFESGFEVEPTETPAPEKKDEPAAGVTPAEQPAEQKEEPPKFRQVTETEWAELAAKAKELDEVRTEQKATADKVFGKIGGIERVLKDLQAKTPQGVAVDVTDEDVADLKAEFPELGEHVQKILQRVAGKLKGTGTATSVDPEIVGKAVLAETRRLQTEALDEEYPDWRKITAPDTEYRKWLEKQPAEYQERLNSSGSATVVARSIRRFQDDMAAAKAEADAAAKAKAEADAKAKAEAERASKRQQRFAEAVTQKGLGGHPEGKTEDDAFMEGFNT